MTEELPLFPLQTVLFPGGLLSLKVFEARYLDLASTCLREKRRRVAIRVVDFLELPAGELRPVLLEHRPDGVALAAT